MTVVLFVVGILVMIVGLAVSIALHELGHLWPAKRFGVRVGQYMIGFGPTLWSRRIGATEYGFKLLPLGGYISMAGMYPPMPVKARTGRAGGGFFATMVQDARDANADTLEGDDDQHVFYKLPVYKRVIVMLGGPTMNLLLAIVLFTIVFSGIGVQTATTTVSALSECVPASSTSACTPSDPVPPAASAGFEPGDTIVSIDGTPMSSFTDVSDVVKASPGIPLSVVVERDGAQQSITVTPATIESGGGQTGFLGVSPTAEFQRQPIWDGAAMAMQNTGQVAAIIVKLPVMIWDTGVSLVTGQERDPNGPLSVVGVAGIAGEVAAADAPVLNRVSATLSLVASLNIALFVFNLIPLLPLDGGHVAVALWDGLKRAWAKLTGRAPPKPVDATKLVPVTFVVVVALIAMGAVLILADLINPISIFGG
ncbi:MAG TPA: M50 family metallopeptidase [Microbacterium sp.]|nr:M50 family metallopeptidase [Microbacterium sp.]